jgi:hypothetical protein
MPRIPSERGDPRARRLRARADDMRDVLENLSTHVLLSSALLGSGRRHIEDLDSTIDPVFGPGRLEQS